ncbi:hypothetical protein V6N13_074468 [Hibiscus sabdariffa]|uniref:Uncharacterized protein n=1 Tax=Hibiscus sabdariffa TaxID=183260 RepID=A0ABR2U8Y7_9ROSI
MQPVPNATVEVSAPDQQSNILSPTTREASHQEHCARSASSEPQVAALLPTDSESSRQMAYVEPGEMPASPEHLSCGDFFRMTSQQAIPVSEHLGTQLSSAKHGVVVSDVCTDGLEGMPTVEENEAPTMAMDPEVASSPGLNNVVAFADADWGSRGMLDMKLLCTGG